jgi:hypothetical protein
MNEQHIEKDTLPKTDWDRFRSMTDEEIDRAAKSDPDSQPTDELFWVDAELVLPVENQEIIAWFKAHYGDDYRKKMSGVLKAFMESTTVS